MSLSMYQASIPAFIRFLGGLSNILKKAEAWAEAKKIEPAVLINARLAPDMFPLSRQIQIASDGVKGCAARLAGVEVPSWPDNEATFPELQMRLKKTVDYLKSFTPAQIDGAEEKAISLKAGPRELKFIGRDYLFNFVIPNLYFHITAAYAILRHNGLDIGKRDYLADI